jgi:hypothetical protein
LSDSKNASFAFYVFLANLPSPSENVGALGENQEGFFCMAREGDRSAIDRFDLFKYFPVHNFDLNHTLRGLTQVRQPEHRRHNIAVILDLAPELPQTGVDGQQIENVLCALLERAKKTILNSNKLHGTITIRTRLNGGKVQLSITDDGLTGSLAPFIEETLDKGFNLTKYAEIVQDQAGDIYAWRPRCTGFTTNFVDLPIHC